MFFTRLYGITGTELTHLLHSFKSMAHKRPDYLTADVGAAPAAQRHSVLRPKLQPMQDGGGRWSNMRISNL